MEKNGLHDILLENKHNLDDISEAPEDNADDEEFDAPLSDNIDMVCDQSVEMDFDDILIESDNIVAERDAEEAGENEDEETASEVDVVSDLENSSDSDDSVHTETDVSKNDGAQKLRALKATAATKKAPRFLGKRGLQSPSRRRSRSSFSSPKRHKVSDEEGQAELKLDNIIKEYDRELPAPEEKYIVGLPNDLSKKLLNNRKAGLPKKDKNNWENKAFESSQLSYQAAKTAIKNYYQKLISDQRKDANAAQKGMEKLRKKINNKKIREADKKNCN